jgi:altronate hydrolase
MSGFLRADRRKGVRNRVLVAYTVDCARHVAEEIGESFRDKGVRVIGFPNCYPSNYGHRMLQALAAHPNVGATLIVSLGCESFRKQPLLQAVKETGRPAELLTIQKAGGTRATIASGEAWVENALKTADRFPRAPVTFRDLVVGVHPGDGSRATARELGGMVDRLLAAGATVVIDDLAKGRDLAPHAADGRSAARLEELARRARAYRHAMGDADPEPGCGTDWVGSAAIDGLIRPGERLPANGLYLLDNVPDGEPLHGPFDIDVYLEMAELASCGAQLMLFGCEATSPPVDCAIAPVLRLCAEPAHAVDIVGDGVDALNAIAAACDGAATAAEREGSYAFTLIHKHLEPAAVPA